MGGAVETKANGLTTRNPESVHRSLLRSDRLSRRILAWGFLVSVVFHAGVLFLWRGALVPLSEESRAREVGTRPDIPAGTLIGIRVRLVSQKIPPPPRPQLVLEQPAIPEIAFRRLLMARAFSAPLLRPVGLGAAGVGAASLGEEDGPGRATPPIPRSVLPEWGPPSSVRGMEVVVRVFVDRTGTPTGQVELIPSTPDPGFNRRLEEKILRMEFHPARLDGIAVPGWAEITFIF